MLLRWLFPPTALILLTCLTSAQNYAPPAALVPDEAKLKAIAERTDKLANIIGSLRRRGIGDPLLADVEVFHKAGQWLVKHQEFYTRDSADQVLDTLDRGLFRAALLMRGEAVWLQENGHAVVRGYRSRVDDSVQPYAITFPADYGKNAQKKWRLDVVLHGRDASLTEVKFVQQHTEKRAAAMGQDWVQLDIYGRGNNAYRWAGETDVFEAIDNFTFMERFLGRESLLHPGKVVLRGFSMGGAGTWQLGLHRPDNWCVIGPGAGFTTTKGYAKLDDLPAYQDACLHIYDAVDYAENAFNVPVVAYSGADDPQKAAADNIERELKKLQIPMTHLVAPGLKHRFPPEWQAKVEEEFQKYTGKGRPEYPHRVRFTTWTLKYPGCNWVEILGLDQHYQRASVDATLTDNGYEVKTANVRLLHLGMEPGSPQTPRQIGIDGQKLTVTPRANAASEQHLYLERRDGKWSPTLAEKIQLGRIRKPQKMPRLQGPIDDAFTAPFLCVRGTGQPWHEATGKYAEANLARFEAEWDRFLRGKLPVKNDVDVTAEDLANRHLILFGDPSSNSLLAQVLDGLPLKWTKDKITLAGKDYAAGSHVPVMIYPSPLYPERYVVLNSGHTFHAADFRATNAMLFPRLGDYAVLQLAATEKEPLNVEVATAGLFDDYWK